MEHGLPDNTVSRIYRDNDGFMWFATRNGISRYDGANFKNFALPGKSQVVTNLFGSSNNYIWTWGNGALNCLNTESEKFMEVELPSEVVSDNVIYTSKVYNDSIAWLITQKSVFKTLVTTHGNNNRRKLELISKQLNVVDNGEQISSTDIDKRGNLYLSTNQNRILIIDIENKTIDKNRLNLRKSLASTGSQILHIDVIDNSVWVNTSGQGVVRFFLDTKEVQQFDDYPQTKLQIPHTNVFHTAKLNDNQYILATWNGYHVITYDESDRIPLSIKNYSNSYSDTHRSVECRIGSMYVDNDNILWLGTFGSGLIVSNLNLQFYKQYHQDNTNAIESMVVDHNQYLWISTYHKGVFRSKNPIDERSNLDFKLISNSVIKGVKTYSVRIASDSKGNVWGGTRNGVLMLYGENGVKKMIDISVDSLNSALAITCLYFDKRDNLWLGTPKGALCVYDKQAGKARLITDIGSARINSISEDQTGCLWFSSAKGAVKYDPITRSSVRYAEEMVVNSTIATLNGVFIGSSKGLVSIDANGDSVVFSTKNGLCNDNISSIIEGDDKEIWVCNDSGISRYSNIDKTLFNYYVQSSNSSSARAADGTLFFGNNKSITYFNPSILSDLYERIKNRNVKITELKIVGEAVSAGDTVNGDVVLSKSIQHTDKIVLNYKNNNFSLSVSNLLFNDVHQFSMYRMLPVQQNWTTITNSTSISYAALPAGKYLFQVKDYSHGNGETPITELEIRINEHWIYSTFVKVIGGLLLLFAIGVAFVRMRLGYKRQLYLSQLNAELESQRTELDREKKTNQERVNFFTYASHELRTPLTLIISPVKELLSYNDLKNDVRARLVNIDQNAQSLLNITDKLLDFQQLDAKITRLNLSKVDLYELVKRVVSNFDLLCRDNNIEIVLINNTGQLQVWLSADWQKIESVVENLISNSVKYRKEVGARIEVELGKEEIDDLCYITIRVRDNGQGISNEAQKTIFESFSTDDNKPLFSTKVGVGLFIVRNIVELHHGNISLSSALNEGTSIMLHLPQDYEYPIENNPSESHINEVAQKNKKKILVVEDNIGILNHIRSLFCDNYDVLTAESGEEGLRVAKESLPDIILQDIVLPDINGIECCRELIGNYETSHIPIILLSANADEQSVMDGSKAGAADYVVKPFNPHILKTKVASLISSREMLRQIYSKSLMLNGESVHKVFEDNFMQKIINITEQNMTDPGFGVDLLAQKLNMSTSTLRRYIKAHSDLPVNSIIRDVRLTKAASLIISQKYRVVEIAEMVGYNDISSFRVQFTKKFGISPSKFHNA